MPTQTEREYYAAGFRDGMRAAHGDRALGLPYSPSDDPPIVPLSSIPRGLGFGKPKKRKLSAWNKFVKANSKKPRFRMRSGKLNLKKMGVAFRKTPAGKKKRR